MTPSSCRKLMQWRPGLVLLATNQLLIDEDMDSCFLTGCLLCLGLNWVRDLMLPQLAVALFGNGWIS